MNSSRSRRWSVSSYRAGRRRRRRTGPLYRPVKPEYLVWPTCERNAGCFTSPCRADTKTAAGVSPSCALIRLHCAIPPAPRSVWIKRHIRLDLDPVGPGSEHRHARQVDRKSAAYDRERLIHRAVNLRARQTCVVGVEEHIETVGRSGKREVHPVGGYGLHIPSLTCGNNEIVREIGTKRGEIGERRGQGSND